MTDTQVMTPPVLTRHDRCDQEAVNPAAAVAYVQLTDDPATGLMFCGHHFDKVRLTLKSHEPYIMYDSRYDDPPGGLS